MSSVLAPRSNVPQAFVSSYAPRIRTYANSLLTPVQPATVIPSLRTTKRGTTAINYSEDFEDDSIEDSDAPRRPTGLRSLRRDGQDVDKAGPTTAQGKELYAPVDVQAIWRDWMGKPKRNMTEKQVQVQATLPLNLVPIRIDLSVPPYQPEPALPRPHNAREMGIDENSAAYKIPDITPEYKLKDYFLWNLHEALMTPDQFAKVFVDELDFPNDRKTVLVMQITQQIRTQLEDHAGVALHPFFNPSSAPPPSTQPPSVRPPLSRDQSGTPLTVGTPNNLTVPQTNGFHTPNPPAPASSDSAISATAQAPTSQHNPDDAYRCVISISINLQNRLYTDKFEWSLLHPPGFAEIFAKQTCADIGLSGEWVPALAHAIYEAVLKIKKDVCENGGSLLGVVGSGVNAWGEVENEAAEVHGDGSLAVGEGAGWRFDHEHLGDEWEPRVETLSKEEIEKREGDRERQIRRLRRETAARASILPQAGGFNDFGSSFNAGSGAGEEERMGRGERSKKKRRFRSLSPVGRGSPDLNAAFGGESGKLNEGERQYWHCSHCRVWGGAVWSVRDGPNGHRSLCNNCGLLYERDKRLPLWSKDLYANERAFGTARPDPAPVQSNARATSEQYLPHPVYTASSIEQGTPAAQRPAAFVPNPARAHSQTFFRHSSDYEATVKPPVAQDLPEQYAATARGGGPAMFDDYAVQGEDLDWTKVTDPRERKRLQNIINGRKYRERKLAYEADHPGVAAPPAMGLGSSRAGSATGSQSGGFY